MDAVFEDSNCSGFESLVESLKLPDENDRHVLALAINEEAKFIITNNHADFPNDTLTHHNIKAISPDDFLEYLFIERDMGELIVDALAIQRGRLKNPPFDVPAFLEKLEAASLTKLRKNLSKFEDRI